MSADILDRLDFMLISRRSDEDAIIRDARAEIVLLRGEACSCPSGDGSLRWPCKTHPPESIAPAEAKDPAPAMPNGVEDMHDDLSTPDLLNEAERIAVNQYKDGRYAAARILRILCHRLRAADNRDAAGVEGNGPDLYSGPHAPCIHPKRPPAAVPAGEAVALYQLRKADGSWIDQSRNSYDYNMANGHADDLRIVYTTPPAPVQAAPQEGEAPHGHIRWLDNGYEIDWLRDWTGGDCDLYLAARPSACELGAVRELPAKWRQRAEQKISASQHASIEQKCIARFRADDELDRANELEAALQHRGDSRGGEGA